MFLQICKTKPHLVIDLSIGDINELDEFKISFYYFLINHKLIASSFIYFLFLIYFKHFSVFSLILYAPSFLELNNKY